MDSFWRNCICTSSVKINITWRLQKNRNAAKQNGGHPEQKNKIRHHLPHIGDGNLKKTH